jgi:hypothetical protein
VRVAVEAEEFVRACVPGAAGVRIRRSPYATSHLIQEVDVDHAGGGTRRFMLKRLGDQDLLEQARGIRPAFVDNPDREPFVYQSILQGRDLGTAGFHGCGENPLGGLWMLLERVPGVELFQVGDRKIWEEVARWLARAHGTFLVPARHLSGTSPLLTHDAAFYRRWPLRALDCQKASTGLLTRVQRRWEELVDRLLHPPRTILHGEFYASNVLVVRGDRGIRVCPVDWEMASLGPSLIDLAALTSGWSAPGRGAIAAAYCDELDRQGSPLDPASFATDLTYCRMFLCVQWLGWAPLWMPPSEHANDWLAETAALAEELNW